MDLSSPQQNISDVDNVTVSSPEKETLLVDVNVALIINIVWNSSQAWALGSMNNEVRKWRFKKVEWKLKYCIEKTYEVEVKSSASALDESNKDLCLCCVMSEELQAICKRSISCIGHVQILTQSPFTTIERTMKEFLKLPCEKELSTEERKGYSWRVALDFFIILSTHTPFFPGNFWLFSSLSSGDIALPLFLVPSSENTLFFMLCCSLLSGWRHQILLFFSLWWRGVGWNLNTFYTKSGSFDYFFPFLQHGMKQIIFLLFSSNS